MAETAVAAAPQAAKQMELSTAQKAAAVIVALGAAMQKYLVDRSDREELIASIQSYWDEQK